MSEKGENGARGRDVLPMTVEIVASYLRNNKVPAENIADLIRMIHATIAGLSGAETEAAPERPKPAAPINKSVQREFIICLEDGKKLKMLKRYLRTTYNMTPDQYRKRWGLPADYPMVAPAYAARRSDFAKQIGLGKAARKRQP